MARPWTLPAGCGESQATSSRSLPSTAHISAVRCAGFRNPVCSCVRATAARTTATARAPRDRRSADCSNIRTRLRTACSRFKPANCRRRVDRLRSLCHGEAAMRMIAQDRRLVRPALAARGADSRSRRASRAAQHGELVLRVRQRGAHRLPSAARDRHSAGADLRALGRRSMEQPAGSESRGGARLVHPRAARMGLQLHGGDRPHSHGAGVSVRRLQVSA